MKKILKLKKSSFLGVVIAVILVFSGFLAVANRPVFSIEGYELNTIHYYVAELSDEEILSLVDSAVESLPVEERSVFSSFTSEDILAIARGTDSGRTIIQDFTSQQKDVASKILEEIIYNGDRELLSGTWGRKPAPTTPPPTPVPVECPKVPAPSCIPGSWRCDELSEVLACDYHCDPSGTWGQSTRCTGALCNGDRCALA